jgi:hypothetical protein
MGFFSSKSTIEQQIKDYYKQFLIAAFSSSEANAESFASEMLQRAKAKAVASGDDKLPQNFGDVMLSNEDKMTNDFKKIMLLKRKEGVRDEDIKWWWNMYYLERGMMEEYDDFMKVTLFGNCIEKGMDKSMALSEVKKYHPIYTDAYKGRENIDDPLPIELKNRINQYTEKRALEDANQYKKDILKASSYNAFVRNEIEKGNL